MRRDWTRTSCSGTSDGLRASTLNELSPEELACDGKHTCTVFGPAFGGATRAVAYGHPERAGKLVELSPTEFNLLRYLLTNAGRVVSKAQILDRVWSYDFGGDGRIVESYVYYLRRKIDRWDPPLIHTVRGVGYALRLPRAGEAA